MERLTPLADAFLSAEDADPAASLAIGSLAVFDGPAPTYAELVALIEHRLPLVPRHRQRVRPVLLDLAPPAWVEDEDFDVRRHVLRAALPTPGGHREIADLVATLMASRMDRSHPLWECWLVEGMPDIQWAVLSRIHHCVADGVSGTDLYRLFLDLTPTATPVIPDRAPPPAAESILSFTVGGLRELAASPSHLIGALGRLARTPLRSAAVAARTTRGLLDLGGAIVPVHPTSLVGPTGADRRFTWVEVHMSDVAAVRRECGASVNDVALAAIAGGFRRLLIGRGEVPDARAVRSLVPVSTRAPGQESTTDNQVSLMLPYLPVEEPDARQRVLEVHRRLRTLRRHHEPEAGSGITSTAALSPFPLVSWTMRSALRIPQHQVTTVTTNVPGPPVPLYCLGRPLRSLVPYVPIADDVRIGVAMLSYGDALTYGVTGDHESVPDLQVLADGIAESWSDLAAR
ncbi:MULTISPECIES: wax ester/triacylglycerol synthase family O-acyltransferase [unclassified Nocardioides]|uniref:wax ester/triacylglycerol synthase family O-acyltransferase n=1 Tax=unclassified Nocardioides TaxID=2615069 RepID=UPI0009EF8522|nr:MULTISPECIES: wax ester/triacylglycerol synthase family O-acyltransferase [unclassified Nocardioides]GAW52131.1 diacylglycerol O-acyltransferase [Nocardioides sp. PD653-B2]